MKCVQGTQEKQSASNQRFCRPFYRFSYTVTLIFTSLGKHNSPLFVYEILPDWEGMLLANMENGLNCSHTLFL